MRKVYVSFLGRGSFDPQTSKYSYKTKTYELNGRKSSPTPYVQAAEIELLGADSFDLVLIAATKVSYSEQFRGLQEALAGLGVSCSCILLEESFDPSTQWKWFELILDQIQMGDILTVDLTHGYRAIPILFSTAINFLQKARNITLAAVYYGAMEANPGLVPIVDMQRFYLVNEWAEALARVVEDLDTKKLISVAPRSVDPGADEINDQHFLDALISFTDRMRNVEVDFIGDPAATIKRHIEAVEASSSAAGKILLNVLKEKIGSLYPPSSSMPDYGKEYFSFQIQIIRLLLEHKLYMQAYTAMQEFIASLGMIHLKAQGMTASQLIKKRARYGQLFIRMLTYGQWEFEESERQSVQTLEPFYNRLKELEIKDGLSLLINDLSKYRNGFDHAWAGRKQPSGDIREKAYDFMERLEHLYNLICARIDF